MTKKEISNKDKLTNRYLIQFAYDVIWAILIMMILLFSRNFNTLDLARGIETYGAVAFAVIGVAMLLAWTKRQTTALSDGGLNFIAASLGCLYLRFYSKIIYTIFGADSFLRSSNMEFKTLYCILAVIIIIQTVLYLVSAQKIQDDE